MILVALIDELMIGKGNVRSARVSSLRFPIAAAALVVLVLLIRTDAGEIGRLVSPLSFSGDCFGCSIAIDDDTLAIGEPGGSLSSQVQGGGVMNVFVRSGGEWALQQRIQPIDNATNDDFGTSVDLLGDTLVVGAPRDDQSGTDNRGSVYIFTRSGTVWTQQAKISPNDLLNLAWFGSSVSISEETILVGAPGQIDTANQQVGSAYVFVRAGNLWTQEAKLEPSDGDDGDGFGWSVDLSGDTALIGSPLGPTPVGSNTGTAYVFTRSGVAWSLQSKLIGNLISQDDRFGWSVALDGDIAIVGSPFDDVVNVGNDAGSAYIFVRNGTAWTEERKIISINAFQNAFFGRNVAINSGVVGIASVAVGALVKGSVAIYRRFGTQWRRRQLVTSTTVGEIGVSIALDDRFIFSAGFGGFSIPGLHVLAFNLDPKLSTEFDFEGDAVGDLAVFRPSSGQWYIRRSANETLIFAQWGLATDIPVSGDFDGDGRSDIAIWRPGPLAELYILNSRDGTVRIEQFGQTGDEIGVVGDWDGDGLADPAVYRNAAVGQQSFFFYRGSLNNPNGNVTFVAWGSEGDRPLRGDFDGDGKQDPAVFRPADNTWYVSQSSTGTLMAAQYGFATDVKIPGDFDGDGKTDLAVFRDGLWIILQSSNGVVTFTRFGIASDLPVPADFDGDGKTDIAIYRGGTWWMLQSTKGLRVAQFGLNNDIPIQASMVP